MLANYIKIAFRNIIRNRWYSAINIFGLAIGMASSILLILWIQDELSYDRFNTKSEYIYRVSIAFNMPNYQTHFARVPFGYINNLPKEFQEIKELVRLGHDIEAVVKKDNIKFNEDGFFITDSNFFDLFDIDLIEGDKKTALSGTNSMVLTRASAQKYFTNEDPIGKSMTVFRSSGLGDKIYTITGILDETPSNSHFHIDFLASQDYPIEENVNCWNYIYILIDDYANPATIEEKLSDFIIKYNSPKAVEYQKLHLTPLNRIHLYSSLDREIEPNGNVLYIYIFLSAGLLILIVAAINFANLSVSQSINRTIEAGIRKTVGACNRNLALQFLIESTLISAIALMAGIIIVEITLPWFNGFTGKALTLDSFMGLREISGIIILTILTGGLSGAYPAIYFSSVKPLTALNRNINFLGRSNISGSGKFAFRNILVVIQFSVAIGLIISCFITYSQYDYLISQRLGNESEQVMAIPKIPMDAINKYPALKKELLNQPGVLDVTATMEEPSRQVLDAMDFEAEGVENTEAGIKLYVLPSDSNFINFWDIKLLAGTDFMASGNSGEDRYIINETAARSLGYIPVDKAIGKRFKLLSNYAEFDGGTIIGVISDFVQSSLKKEIQPMVLFQRSQWYMCILVKIDPSRFSETMTSIKKTWNNVNPNYPLQYRFVDELFARLYQSEKRQGDILGLFSLIGIFVTGLGLFGLTSYTVKKRRKEIGIRRVMGANIGNIIALISKEYLLLIIISNIIIWPIAYYAMKKWLENFAYRIDIGIVVFLWAGFSTLFLAIIVVGWQAYRAATVNPAEVIKHE
ncbi:MAG: ABC transporter permease [Candidatus Zixiibacteriota bacterium]